MGRYYNGDIEGKFWFGVQSSAAADRFGVEGTLPGYLDYYFDEDNLEDIESELKHIEDKFGDLKDSLLTYFDLYKDPSEAPLSFTDYLIKGDKPELPKSLYEEFADYILGKKILNCVKETGSCSFTAEL